MTGILLGINNFILAANTVDFYDCGKPCRKLILAFYRIYVLSSWNE